MVGDVLMRGFHVTFDRVNEQIGFAPVNVANCRNSNTVDNSVSGSVTSTVPIPPSSAPTTVMKPVDITVTSTTTAIPSQSTTPITTAIPVSTSTTTSVPPSCLQYHMFMVEGEIIYQLLYTHIVLAYN